MVRDASAVRGRRTWANGNRGSPGTWEILPSPRKPSRTGIPGDQPQARRRPRAPAAGAKWACSRGAAKRRKRSVAGGTAGSRSALIVPRKRGNNRPSGPRGGKRGIGIMDSLLGHSPDTWRFDERIDETATDSRAGEPRFFNSGCATARRVAKPCPEEPYALMRACTDLWGPRVGNRPAPPGHDTYFGSLRGLPTKSIPFCHNRYCVPGIS
jgi:hypothetical protein